jgi:hypothetical protein
MPLQSLDAALPLSGWQNFYVIVGSSAAALTGLTFIVITIASEGMSSRTASSTRLLGLRAFITPTVVHFASSLGLSALLAVPAQTARSLAICLAVGGVAGLAYAGNILRWMRSMHADYEPQISDWVWNLLLPALAYGSLLGAAALLLRQMSAALYVAAGVTLLLLYVGIHNAWDVVAWVTTERHAERERQRAQLPPVP